MRENEIECAYCGTVNELGEGESSCICEFCGREVSLTKEEPGKAVLINTEVPVTDIKETEIVDKVSSSSEDLAPSETEVDRLFEMIKNQYTMEKKQSFNFNKKTMTIIIASIVVIFLVSMILTFSFFSRMSDAIMQNSFGVMTESEYFYEGDLNE